MKILHVIDQISQTKHGGSAKMPYQMAKEQARLGHDVTIYASDYEAKDQTAPAGVKLVKFKTAFTVGAMRVTPGMLLADFNYDVVHLHNYRIVQGLIAGLRHGRAPLVVQAHGNNLPIIEKTRFLHQLLWPNVILKRARRLIADVPEEFNAYLADGVDYERIKLIPIGIDLDEFTNLPKRHSNGKKNILFLGRLHKIKGVDLLIGAFKELDRPDTRLIIAGPDYGEEAMARAMVKDLGIEDRVVFTGGLSGWDKLQAYVNADVFCMPSRYEIWGLTFMESLACGTPVIMTNTCKASSILPVECGKVTPFSEIPLAYAINDILNAGHDNFLEQYRKAWVKQYSWPTIIERIINLYGAAIDEQGK